MQFSILTTTYTVPDNRSAQVQVYNVRVTRTVAATSADAATVYLQSGNGAFGYAEIMTNNVGDFDSMNGDGPFLLAGDFIRAIAQDLSTYTSGSGVRYRVSAHVYEFDA